MIGPRDPKPADVIRLCTELERRKLMRSWPADGAERALTLAEAEAEMRELLAVADDAGEAESEVMKPWARIGDLFGVINGTPPTSLHDCVVKLRFLADPDVGIIIGAREDDVPALRQVLAFLEAQL